eukprot:80065-Prymnesium_polylepis.1
MVRGLGRRLRKTAGCRLGPPGLGSALSGLMAEAPATESTTRSAWCNAQKATEAPAAESTTRSVWSKAHKDNWRIALTRVNNPPTSPLAEAVEHAVEKLLKRAPTRAGQAMSQLLTSSTGNA